MSLISAKLCTKILEEHFGPVVSKVGAVLLQKGEISLIAICKDLPNILKVKIQNSLSILIQFNMVTFRAGPRSEVLYLVDSEEILYMLRYNRYQLLIGELYDRHSEMIVDALLHEGQAPASTIIVNSALMVLEAGLCPDSDELHILMKTKLAQLIRGGFIQRCPINDLTNKKVPKLSIEERDLYFFPEDKLDLKKLKERITNNLCESSEKNTIFGDEEILWKIHFNQFHLEMRDNEIKNAIARRIDPLASECVRALLKQCYTTCDPWLPNLNPIPVARVKANLKDFQHIEQYLRILEEDSGNLISRHGDDIGGEYLVNMCAMFEAITNSVVDDMINAKYGSESARIFRLIRENKMMEPDSISRLAMLSAKTCNLHNYDLFKDRMIQLNEIRKAGATPSPVNKNYYLYHVNMLNVVRRLLERSYKILYNVMTFRFNIYNENKKLLEKKARIDAIVESLRASGATQEQIQEVEDMLTKSEQIAVKKVIEFQDKLLEKEYSTDETIFIFNMYLYYKTKCAS